MSTLLRFEMILVLNVLTGSAAYGFWRLLAKRLSKENAVPYVYYGLKAVLLLFAAPVIYIMLVLRYWNFSEASWSGWLTVWSPFTCVLLKGLGIVWGIGALCALLHTGKPLFGEVHILTACRSHEGRETEILKRICTKMGIRRTISLRYAEEKHSPSIGGIFCPRIYMGGIPCTDEELCLIFRHELTHYRHRDLWIQGLLLIFRIIYWFHPLFFTGRIAEDNRAWSEDYCDYEVCRKEDRKAYIRTLLKLAIAGAEERRIPGAGIAETKSDVLRRIEKMENNRDKKKMNPWAAAAWMTAFFLAAGSTSYAAGLGMVESYGALCRATEVNTQEELQPAAVYIEHTEAPGEGPEWIIIEQAEEPASRASLVSIAWTISANSEKQSSLFEKKSGDSISISVFIDPEDRKVDVGIVEPDGGRRYIAASGDISHTFELDQSGSYQVFIRNRNSVKVSAKGVYRK